MESERLWKVKTPLQQALKCQYVEIFIFHIVRHQNIWLNTGCFELRCTACLEGALSLYEEPGHLATCRCQYEDQWAKSGTHKGTDLQAPHNATSIALLKNDVKINMQLSTVTSGGRNCMVNFKQPRLEDNHNCLVAKGYINS